MADEMESGNLKNEEIFVSRGLYQAIFETTGNPMIIINSDGVVVLANPEFSSIIGLPKETIEQNFNLSDFVHPDDLEVVLEYYYTIMTNPDNVPGRHNVRFVDSFGEVYYMIVTVARISGTNNCVVSGIDITCLKEAEEKLKKNEWHYHSLVELHPEPIFIHYEGKLVFANPAGLNLFGVNTPDELVDMNILEYLRVAGGDVADKHIKNSYKMPEECFWIEGKVIHTDGNLIDVEVYSVPTRYNGQPATIAIVHDITSRKKVEAEMKFRNHQLSIINQIICIANSSLILDEMLEIILNKVLELLHFDMGCIYLKYSDSQRVEMAISEGVPAIFMEKRKYINIHSWPYNLIFFANQVHYVENLPDHPPGQVDSHLMEELGALSFVGIPLVADNVVLGAMYIGRSEQYYFSDEDKEIIGSIGKEIGGALFKSMLQEQLEFVNEEANLYLDVLLHDIGKNSKSAIMECADMLSAIDDKFAQHYAGYISDIVRQINEIINNVSLIREINSGEEEHVPVDLSQIIKEVISQYPDADIRHDDIACNPVAGNLLREVLINLIGNSIKFGGPDVSIWISVTEKDGVATISVEDSGPGVSDELKPIMFSYFQRCSHKKSGRGLGLHISRILIEQYGGRIWAEDRIPGKSTEGLTVRFSLRLPGRSGTIVDDMELSNCWRSM